MHIIDCYWEKENLNKKVVEIFIRRREDLDEKLLSELERNYEYLVIKTEVNDAHKYFQLQERNYKFVESQISISKLINKINTENKSLKLLLKTSSIEIITSRNDLDNLCSMITEDMFSTDRIYIDPNFGPQWSKKRYINWVRTEFERGTTVCWMIHKGVKVGFRLYKVTNGIYHGLLGGIFNNYQGVGIGALTTIGGYLCALNNPEIKNIETKISSNNIEVLKLYNYFDFKIDNIHNVFVKSIK